MESGENGIWFFILRPGLLPLLGSLRFHVLFHSPVGVLFTLPSRYYFAIGHPGVFSLARWSLLIHMGFHVPHATRVRALSLACPWIQQQFERLTYSRISGSMLIFNSPKHFVAYYALPRLWVPSYLPLNRRIGKIGCYHIALYRLSSRVRDKRTRTADIRRRVNHRLSGPPTDSTIEAISVGHKLWVCGWNPPRRVKMAVPAP
ncbi:hypothetical protein Tco_1339601 [Tanacetum coccineum]